MGFTMWPSSRTFGWNAKDIGPKRDVVGELADAVRGQGGVRFGLYHSLFEWYHPLYLQDKANNKTTRDFVVQKMTPELKELIRTYKPEVLWSDGDWEAKTDYWDSLGFLSWLYNESPVKDTIVTNDRWGSGIPCKHGGFFTCTDRYNPGVLQAHKWENAMTVDRESWGHRRNMQLKDVLSMDELIETLVKTVSCGGNLLMNIGPSSDGSIEPIFQERLRQMGDWLAVNGEAIYETNPWHVQNDTLNSKVWYTSKVESKDGIVVFAHVLGWPEGGLVQLGSVLPNPAIKVSVLGFEGSLGRKEVVRTSATLKARDQLHQDPASSISDVRLLPIFLPGMLLALIEHQGLQHKHRHWVPLKVKMPVPDGLEDGEDLLPGAAHQQQVLGLVERYDPRVALHRRRALLVLQGHALLAQQVDPFHLSLSRHIWVGPRHGHTWPLGTR